jgi:hypothetical protein
LASLYLFGQRRALRPKAFGMRLMRFTHNRTTPKGSRGSTLLRGNGGLAQAGGLPWPDLPSSVMPQARSLLPIAGAPCCGQCCRTYDGGPMEFMFGRPLSPEELDMIREQIEGLYDITAIDDGVCGIVEPN